MFRKILRAVSLLSVPAALLVAAPVSAQVNLSGDWSPRTHEDQPDRGPGPELGDYTGLPLTDGARLAADSWDASRLTLRELTGSRPLNGSSRISRSGWWMMVAMN